MYAYLYCICIYLKNIFVGSLLLVIFVNFRIDSFGFCKSMDHMGAIVKNNMLYECDVNL